MSIYVYVLTFVGNGCTHWMHYSDATQARSGWAEELLQEFRNNVDLLKQAVKDHNVDSPSKSPPQVSPQHTAQTGMLFCIWLSYIMNRGMAVLQQSQNTL